GAGLRRPAGFGFHRVEKLSVLFPELVLLDGLELGVRLAVPRQCRRASTTARSGLLTRLGHQRRSHIDEALQVSDGFGAASFRQATLELLALEPRGLRRQLPLAQPAL